MVKKDKKVKSKKIKREKVFGFEDIVYIGVDVIKSFL